MALVFPDWYEGGFPDAELCVMDMLKPLLGLCDPAPPVVNWLPEDYEDNLPIVSVFRGSGNANLALPSDGANVQVWCVGKTRRDAWELLEFCRQMLKTWESGGYVDHADGSRTALIGVSEIDGPELTQWDNFDLRAVHAVFRLEARLPSGKLPDYRRIRKTITG